MNLWEFRFYCFEQVHDKSFSLLTVVSNVEMNDHLGEHNLNLLSGKQATSMVLKNNKNQTYLK